MAGKRSATSDLNHDNWNNDEAPEEAGTFNRAAEDVLKKRVFKTGKRRITKSAEEGSLNVFNPVNLAKFGSKPSQSGNQLFGFLSKLQSDVSKTNGIGDKSNNQGDGDKLKSSPMFSFGKKTENSEVKTNSFELQTENSDKEKNENKNSTQTFTFGNANTRTENKSNLSTFGVSHSDKNNTLNFDSVSENTKTNKADFSFGCKKGTVEESDNKNDQTKTAEYYYARLKGLNESVAKWINKHVQNNPLINLQPIFKDYEKFFEEIEKEKKCDNSANSNIAPSGDQKTKEPSISFDIPKSKDKIELSTNTYKFGISTTPDNVSSSEVTPKSSFGNTAVANNTNKESPIACFKFGDATPNSVSTSDKSPKFSFGTSIKASNENNVPSSANTFKFGASTTSSIVSTSSTSPKFSFVSPDTSSTGNKKESPLSLFKFGSATTSSINISSTNATPKFSFGKTNVPSTGLGFSFGPITNATTINFGSVPAPAPSKSEQNNDEEESDEPPKVDVKQVEEEGHIYTIRCKLFVKKDGNFIEKGVGSLFLKPVPDCDKIQVIVRAHNSLGNVLCNFILSKGIPLQRMGKNNIMVVCIPTPDAKPPPVPVLIKVKTEEDANQLLEVLEKNKK